MNEVWKFVGTENEDYSVSNLGRIRSNHRVIIKSNGSPQPIRERIRKIKPNKKGYCTYHVDSGRKHIKVHSAVMAAFVGPRPEGHQINHIDGNKSNNCLDNLEYCTGLENIRHAIKSGLIKACGEDSSCSKLTELQALEIRKSTKLHREIAVDFGVTSATVSRIKNGKRWPHLHHA
jgi:hypothetical protein